MDLLKNLRLGQCAIFKPDGLAKNPAYTNVAVVGGRVKTIYIGAQGALNATTGTVVDKGDIGVQAEQVMKHIQIALEAAGAKLECIIKLEYLSCLLTLW